MALTRVQATPHTSAGGGGGTVTFTFASPPTLGNGLIVAWVGNAASTDTVTDNYGNTYTLANKHTGSNSGYQASLYYCAALTATGASFVVTVTGNPFINRSGLVIEYSGVGSGLSIDQLVTGDNASFTITVGPTAALTASEVVLIGLIASTSTVLIDVTTPPAWINEFEDVTTPSVHGALASRVLGSAAGTTPSIIWTFNGGTANNGTLAAFQAGAAPGGGGGGGSYTFVG